jgi:Phage tail lysozyme
VSGVLRLLLLGVALAIVLPLLAVVVLLAAAQAQCGDGTPTANVTAPGADPRTEAQFVEYFESQGIPADAAAGIVGNLYQESGLNPIEPGYGLAQWNASWWALASAWISAQRQNPDTAAGQLIYIAANLNQDVDGQEFYPGLKSDMDSASSPQEAAIRWMNDYEQCQGAGMPGTLSFDPAGLCMGEQRERYAVQALRAAGGVSSSGADVFLSLQPGGVCNASYPLSGSIRGYTNPFEKTTGLVWERTDQGVDGRMNAGSPLLAFAASKVELIVGDFYAGGARCLRACATLARQARAP